ncbi:MAG: hypothetical protein EHM56_06575, partial [Chloroflexi bacterium]
MAPREVAQLDPAGKLGGPVAPCRKATVHLRSDPLRLAGPMVVPRHEPETAGSSVQALAALDLGTNNCRLLVARPRGDGFDVLDSFSRIVRLGEGVAASVRLTEQAMARTVAALKICARIMARHKVARKRCVATEACRRAVNGVTFLNRVRRVTGIDFEILPQEQEAELAMLGCLPLVAADAERVLVLMGSAAGAAAEAVEALTAGGERVGLVTVRLYRPYPAEALAAALPATVRRVAVLDRTKEPGATGEPLYQDVVTALAERAAAGGAPMPLVVGGRYGLASKEFTPAMAKAALDSLAADRPRNHFTVGIADDVSHTSLPVDASFSTEDPEGLRAVFYGLGSDGTVGANKTSVTIVGEGTDQFAQGYFVLDSKKSGSVTVSHLRIASRPIRSTYLIGPGQANFVACHQFHFLDRMDVLGRAAPGATFLLNSPWSADQVWDHLPVEVQREIIDKGLD